ncbi:PAP2 family phosphoesterase [Bifidobacterium dolichotidis]|uniref:PAP2 family phosphoesterase n=1 Tax=Bifidobacterium dolichotidis TaxID=2306976 RepID=A0A430FQN3_9BIFI|nr:hypothetical protein [Bifidobacterium dolichotidis]RSX55147.1 PAP2 family phosphoesterase [Bifidobacterium dolichotidis]
MTQLHNESSPLETPRPQESAQSQAPTQSAQPQEEPVRRTLHWQPMPAKHDADQASDAASQSDRLSFGAVANDDDHDSFWSAASHEPPTPVANRASATLPQSSSHAWQTPADAVDVQQDDDDDLTIHADQGLAQLDPLTVRPRRSSIALCVIFAVIALALGAFAFWWSVLTVQGQVFEDGVVRNYASALPMFLTASANWPLANETIVAAIAGVLTLIALIVAGVRRRWRLMIQLAIYCAVCTAAIHFLKPLLPRPLLIHVESNSANSAPSGNMMLAIASSIVLICAVPHAWRALCAVVGLIFSSSVGLTVIVNQWHRPVDVVLSTLIALGLAMIMLAFTGHSGMDTPGTRVSSPSIQIVSSVFITGGLCAIIYGLYVLVQLQPGLDIGSAWTISGSINATTACVFGCTALACGLVLAMRQITASPLTRVGLLGAPPAPPMQ